jgi:tetratricopeptide (TPR) repeat protein
MDNLFSYVESGSDSIIHIRDVTSESSVFLEIRRYISTLDSFKSVEDEIEDLSNELSTIKDREDRQAKEIRLNLLIKERTHFVKNILSLAHEVNKFRKNNKKFDFLDDLVSGTNMSKAIKKLTEFANSPILESRFNPNEELKKNAFQFSLKARLRLLDVENILDVNIEPSIFFFNQGMLSALNSDDNMFHGNYILSFADFLNINSKVESSIGQYNDALNILKLSNTKNKSKIAECHRQLFYLNGKKNGKLNTNHLERAIHLYSSIEDRIQKNVNLSHLYNDAGLVFQSMYDFERAINFYKKSITLKSITERFHTTEITNDLGSTYSNLSLVYKKMKDYDEAKKWGNKSVQFYKKDNIRKPFELANSLNNMATILNASGDRKGAILLFEDVLSIRKHNLDFKSNLNVEKFANIYHNIAALMKREGNLDGAASNITEAIHYYTKLYHRSNISYSYLYFNCLITAASISKESIQYDKSIDFLVKAENVVHSSYSGVDKPKHLGRIFNNISNVFKNTRNREAAYKYINKSIQALSDTSKESYNKELHLKSIKNGITIAESFKDEEIKSDFISLKNNLE